MTLPGASGPGEAFFIYKPFSMCYTESRITKASRPMKLWELLGVRPGVTALTGGGGKTTAMYTLARELSVRGTVICTTTTRILPPEHLPVFRAENREALAKALAHHPCICAGRPAAEGKLAPPPLTPAELAGLADYVLVEADGSRGLPVKAHLSHEPVIPAEAGLTALLIGASAFGRPVREAVHRWERFCGLTGASPDGPVTAENVSLLIAAEGIGDKIFVNQAEEPPALEEARRLAALSPRAVCAGSLRGGNWICLS